MLASSVQLLLDWVSFPIGTVSGTVKASVLGNTTNSATGIRKDLTKKDKDEDEEHGEYTEPKCTSHTGRDGSHSNS